MEPLLHTVGKVARRVHSGIGSLASGVVVLAAMLDLWVSCRNNGPLLGVILFPLFLCVSSWSYVVYGFAAWLLRSKASLWSVAPIGTTGLGFLAVQALLAVPPLPASGSTGAVIYGLIPFYQVASALPAGILCGLLLQIPLLVVQGRLREALTRRVPDFVWDERSRARR
jgi:hypothetical protein